VISSLILPLNSSSAHIDLHVLGGLLPTLRLLDSPAAGVRQAAAYVLATAAQNNPKVQQQVHVFALCFARWRLTGGRS
jgi:hypothetical protein